MNLAVKRLGVGAVALMALVAAWGPADADAASSPGARLLTQMRSAVGEHDFAGVAEVTWRSPSGARKHATVDVRAVGGVLQVTSGGQLVLDEGDHVFFKDELGWSSPVAEPEPTQRPRPDAQWKLSVREGTSNLKRPTTLVVAARADGSPAQRIWIDDETQLPIGREVIEHDGTVQRSFRFVSLEVGQVKTVATAPEAGARAAQPLRDEPGGYTVPDAAEAGYVLVSRSKHSNGVQLVYSDGLFSVSVLEQRGDLDWAAMPAGGVDADVDGAPARRYIEPMGDVLVWERDGVVFTCVSDAPRDVFDSMLGGLAPDESVAERVVDFVLGPFGFN